MVIEAPNLLVFRLVAAVSLLFVIAVGVPWLVRAYKMAKEPGSTSESWALHLSALHLAVVAALIGVSAVSAMPQFLLGAYWLQLIYGLWMFSRLLTRAN